MFFEIMRYIKQPISSEINMKENQTKTPIYSFNIENQGKKICSIICNNYPDRDIKKICNVRKSNAVTRLMS